MTGRHQDGEVRQLTVMLREMDFDRDRVSGINSRCRVMVEDRLFDFEGAYRQMWARSLRCVNCGGVQESVIEQHRRARPVQLVGLSSGEPDYQDVEVHLGAEPIIS